MEQNLFPHARSIEEANLEEERRLCYVAITRARERLTLLYARERTLFGQRGRNMPVAVPRRDPAATSSSTSAWRWRRRRGPA